jgi:hypothetical protein
MKNCNKCGVELTYFNWPGYLKKKRSNRCHACHKAYRQSPEIRDKNRVHSRNWYLKNMSSQKLKAKVHRESNREQYNRNHAYYMIERRKDPEYREKYNAYFREYKKNRKLIGGDND